MFNLTIHLEQLHKCMGMFIAYTYKLSLSAKERQVTYDQTLITAELNWHQKGGK